ncbi:MAG: hypothetical protein P9X27_00315 [Candidatus Kaelpia aquatica]|nr:hypothetical protein [Candidatus Kaelpia aquatica]
MKVSVLAIILSFLWHSIFIFLIQPDFLKIDADFGIPRIKFWGEVFQNIRPYSNIQTADREEIFFLEELFSSEIDPEIFSKKPRSVSYQPLLSVKSEPNLQDRGLNRQDVKEYVVVSSSLGAQGLSYAVEIDDNSQPIMVIANTMSGDFIQDSENWIKMKTGFFYSPTKREILFSRERL